MAPGEGPNGTGATFTDPTHQAADYSLLSTHREHVVVNYGTFELPIGPRQLEGILARWALIGILRSRS